MAPRKGDGSVELEGAKRLESKLEREAALWIRIGLHELWKGPTGRLPRSGFNPRALVVVLQREVHVGCSPGGGG